MCTFFYDHLFLHKLVGEPAWFSAGQNVYHIGDVEQMQKKEVSLSNERKWFETMPVQPWRDIPTNVNGTELDLQVEISATRQLTLLVTLTAAKDLQRRYEHRYNNLFPLLFAIFVDGEAVGEIGPTELSKFGGASQFHDLANAGESVTWTVNIDPSNFVNRLPDENGHKVTMVAAFCERAHEVDTGTGSGLSLDYHDSDPSLLVRSQPATFRWPGITPTLRQNTAE